MQSYFDKTVQHPQELTNLLKQECKKFVRWQKYAADKSDLVTKSSYWRSLEEIIIIWLQEINNINLATDLRLNFHRELNLAVNQNDLEALQSHIVRAREEWVSWMQAEIDVGEILENSPYCQRVLSDLESMKSEVQARFL